MRAVNLLPRDEARRSSSGSRLPLLVVAAGAAAVTTLGALAVLSAGSEADTLRSEVAALEAAMARVPEAPAPVVAPAALRQERADRLAALSAAVSERIPFDRLMREVALVLPDDAWLTGITAAAPSRAAPTAGAPATQAATDVERGVTIQGATYSHESVARVLARFAAMPSLANVQLTASALVEPGQAATPTGSGQQAPDEPTGTSKQKPVVTFTILASVRPGGRS